jgi:predicted O-methyltransferase YrrM
VLSILDYFKTTAEFLDGDSKQTVPTLRGLFDLVLVDADHSALGARIDLQNAWPRVRPGGILVMDDINHPDYPWLTDVWERAVEEWGMWVIPETHGGCNAAIALK